MKRINNPLWHGQVLLNFHESSTKPLFQMKHQYEPKPVRVLNVTSLRRRTSTLLDFISSLNGNRFKCVQYETSGWAILSAEVERDVDVIPELRSQVSRQFSLSLTHTPLRAKWSAMTSLQSKDSLFRVCVLQYAIISILPLT